MFKLSECEKNSKIELECLEFCWFEGTGKTFALRRFQKEIYRIALPAELVVKYKDESSNYQNLKEIQKSSSNVWSFVGVKVLERHSIQGDSRRR